MAWLGKKLVLGWGRESDCVSQLALQRGNEAELEPSAVCTARTRSHRESPGWVQMYHEVEWNAGSDLSPGKLTYEVVEEPAELVSRDGRRSRGSHSKCGEID
jgi:hypothetical protein